MHLQRQVDKLNSLMRKIAEFVEVAVDQAMQSVEGRDESLARTVIANDARINRMEIDIEEECLHTLALYQPVAFDLRYVIAVLKINNDLERIGDHAVGIAEQAIFLSGEPPVDVVPFNLTGMAGRVRQMLRQALESMLNVDAELAQVVRQSDDEVDSIHRHMYEHVESAMRDYPQFISQLISLMSISRQLERIGDLCVNIAEDVIYLAQGDIARHGAQRGSGASTK